MMPSLLDRSSEPATAVCLGLVVFHKAYAGGYPKGLDFDARLGAQSPSSRDGFLRDWESGIDVPGPGAAPMVDQPAEVCNGSQCAGG